MKYKLHVTINNPRGREHDYSVATDSVDAVIEHALSLHPECSSILMSVVPGHSPAMPVTLTEVHQGTVVDESGFSSGFAAPLETVHERLKRCYPEELPRILQLLTEESGDYWATLMLEKPIGPHEPALARCFLWGRSSEGYAYWRKLSKRERTGE